MLVIIEGVNGTGKTTLSTAIKDAYNLVQLKPFGAFRRSGHWDGHGTGSDVLQRLGVPFNTAVEDLFIADTIGTLGGRVDFLLDRALPSGLAYAGEEPGSELGKEMCAVWRSLVHDVPLVAFLLDASHDVASARLAPERRMTRDRHDWLGRSIAGWSQYLFHPVIRIETDMLAIDKAFAEALSHIEQQRRAWSKT